MTTVMSKTQIDRLGDRLKKGDVGDADLRLLDQYRRSFADAFEIVIQKIQNELALEPTERAAKSTPSIVEKLRRESIRLTQIQDIAGCRLVVPDIVTQETVVQSLKSLFEHTTVVDRRQKPSHEYCAVHVIVSCLDKMVEIQVRTSLQHLWAEISEKFSDVIDSTIKYGGGNEDIRKYLTQSHLYIAKVEEAEVLLENCRAQLLGIQPLESLPVELKTHIPEELMTRINEVEQDLVETEQHLANALRMSHSMFNSLKQETLEKMREHIKAIEKLKR